MKTFRMIVLLLLGSLLSGTAVAQETIFNVPSGDVLDKGKTYGEFDFAYLWNASAGTYTPRFVVGIGHQVEIGMNVNGITTPGSSQATPTPTIKWRVYDKNGWAFLVGDHLYVPVQNKTYDIGNYVYAEVTKTFESKMRLTMGTYDCTSHVFAAGNKAGGQFGIEQPLNTRVTLAADWFTGHHAAGYFTPGAAIKLSSKATLYAAYEIGNSDVSHGNHLLLVELGWNFN
ncbi:MAG TPA: hypothetical protein VH596_11375 [Terriglobales bacterium]|jgi:hypothetical protein